MAEVESKTYELAYHLIPDLEEAGVKERAQELSDLVAQSGGSALVSVPPKHIHLSYQIKNKQYAYFGLISFSGSPAMIEKLNSQMKLQNSILRFLLLKKPGEGKELRVLGTHLPRSGTRAKPQEAISKEKARVSKEPAKTKIEGEAMEKEIEKIIEGL